MAGATFDQVLEKFAFGLRHRSHELIGIHEWINILGYCARLSPI
jgi:hypothetical protein